MDFDDLFSLLRALQEHDVEYVLVGGVAMNFHGILRATEDVDLFVRPTEQNIARLRAAFASLWKDDDIESITLADLVEDSPTIRYGPPGTEYAIDILSRLGTKFAFDDLDWEATEVQGVSIRLATPETLHRMKRGTLRPIDQSDAAALRSIFGLEED